MRTQLIEPKRLSAEELEHHRQRAWGSDLVAAETEPLLQHIAALEQIETMLNDRREELAQRLHANLKEQGVVEAAVKLCQRLRELHAHPRYQSVWILHQLHRGPYSGPTYTKELETLEAEIAKAKLE